MAFKYREHKGGLEEAPIMDMQSMTELTTKVHGQFGMKGDEEITIEPYAFDTRVGWDTHAVKADGKIVGFTDGPI